MTNNNTRQQIIDKNQVLTLKLAKQLAPGTIIAICCKNKAGVYNNYVDRFSVNQVAKVKGSKGYILMDGNYLWSYRCIDGKAFTLPDFETGNDEQTVYYITL